LFIDQRKFYYKILAEKKENDTKIEEDGIEDKKEEKKWTNKGKRAENPNFTQKIWYGFKDVWKQTFPSENDIEEIIEKRKEEAIKFRSELVEFTDEMIDEVKNNKQKILK